MFKHEMLIQLPVKIRKKVTSMNVKLTEMQKNILGFIFEH